MSEGQKLKCKELKCNKYNDLPFSGILPVPDDLHDVWYIAVNFVSISV